MITGFVALAALVLSGQATEAAVEAEAGAEMGAAIPAWYLDHVAYMTEAGGRWEADNADYRSDTEAFDTYVVVFTPRFDGTGMTGELFGLQEGEPSAALWTFSGYWDPAAGEAMLAQHGWGGALGIGPIAPAGARECVAAQDFHIPGQASRHERHLFRMVDADTHETVTTHVSASGEETPGRAYVWRRAD